MEATCGIGQGYTSFCHAEFISASQFVILSGAKNLNKTYPNPPLQREGENLSLRSAEGTFPSGIGKILKMPLGTIHRRLKQSSLHRSRNTCAMTDNLSLRSGFGNIFTLPSILRNLNTTPLLSFGHPLPRRGNKIDFPSTSGSGLRAEAGAILQRAEGSAAKCGTAV